MSYQIKKYSYDQAKKLNVKIAPSKNKSKKIDVFKNDKKIASIGDVKYNDFPTWIEKEGKTFANERRKLYKQRHQKNRMKKGSPGYWADKILW